MNDRGRLLLAAGLSVGLFASIAAYSITDASEARPRINEVVTSNAFGLADGWGQHPDWIELHNPGSEVAELGGWGLNDSQTPDGAWRFPEGFSIGPDGHAVVFASGRGLVDPDGNLHTDFALDRQGDDLVLVDPDDVVVDVVAAPPLDRNRSWGRHPSDPSRWCRFLHPTPGEPNGDVCWDDDDMGAPTLSMASGFYDDPIEVEISPARSGDEVWYTLDGSYPDPEANPDSTMRYEEPLTIEPAVSSDDRGLPGAVALRSRVLHGQETTATYFVGGSRHGDLPVVSLVLDEDYLFDHDEGIYVTGRVREEFQHSGAPTPERSWEVPANFNQRGREWERPALDRLHDPVWFHWCDAGGSCGYQNSIGIRIHGNATRAFPRKSFRLYARDELGERRFEHPFFGSDSPSGHRRLLLRNSGNAHSWSLVNDGYLQSLMGHFAADTQAFRPTVVYLNGDYWGIYNLRERFDQHYLELVHGADADTVVLLDFGRITVEVGDPSGADFYLALLGWMQDNPPASLMARERIEATIDVDSFFDFVIAHVFVGNRDWAGNNARAWRQPDGNGTGTLDGRWRWLIVDLDLAGNDRLDPTYDAIVHRLPPTEDRYLGGGIPLLFNHLVGDPRYRDAFLNRFADHMNSTFRPERTVPLLDDLESELESEIPRHIARWEAPSSVDAWYSRMEQLRSFMQERPAIQWQQLLERFELEGTAPVTIRSDQSQGHVRLNSLHLREGTPGVFGPEDWSGDYFLGVPVQFEAIPADGHRFVRWEGVPAEMAEVRQLTRDVTGPMTLRAVFEPEAG